eukprot:3551974-Rhodomonas_salina.1
MVSKKDKAKALEESDSESDAPRRSTRRGSSVERSEALHGETEVTASVSDTVEQHMERIEESMSDASLRTPGGAKGPAAADNPEPEESREGEAEGRKAEIELLQSRLPFVPKQPFCLDGLSEEERKDWLPNLHAVISQAAHVSYDNLSLISGGTATVGDGSGPMAALDLSQIVLMWGSLWESA